MPQTMLFRNWRFREIFSLVGAILFGSLALVQITGVYDVASKLPSSVTNALPAGVDVGTALAGIALLALVGTALFVYTRIKDEVRLPEESLS